MRLRAAVSLLAVALVSVPSNRADEPAADTSAFLQSVVTAPAISAAARRTTAARARIESAGRLADPEVEGMTSRMKGPMGERSTMYEVNLRQPLPKRGERAADRERAQAAANMADADYAAMVGEMAADTAMALAEAESATARIRLLETNLGRLDAVLRSIEARLAAGTTGRLADRLTVQTRVASMQLMIEEERRMAADALSAARGRLGLSAAGDLPKYAAPSIAEIKADEAAAVHVAGARAEEATAMAKMARASAHPMTAVGVRLERERTGMGDEDTIGLAFMSEIPWRGRRYARADIRAAEADRFAAESDATAARFRIASALTRVERAERLADTSRRLSSETLGRLDAEYDSMIRSAAVAGSGESTIFQTVELLEKATDTELQVIQADLSARVARAELWKYLPVDRFPKLNN